jgi:hypothetical protein
LIDFAQTDLEILHILATKLWDVYVPVEVLAEVQGLDKKKAEHIGLFVYEATIEELKEVAAHYGGALSDRDRLCFCVARNHGWACLTNDRRLGRECRGGAVTVVRSLHSLRCLHEAGLLDYDRAVKVANGFHKTNPRFITRALVQKFIEYISW